MNWQPISETELTIRIENEICDMSQTERDEFERARIKPRLIKCKRGGFTAEKIYAVAESNGNLIVFDDVEDEFGVGAAQENGSLEEWSLFGRLADALRGSKNSG